MYANVPCYNLPALHAAIKHDLPPTPDGLWGVWTVIHKALREQAADPSYKLPVELPPRLGAGPPAESRAECGAEGKDKKA